MISSPRRLRTALSVKQCRNRERSIAWNTIVFIQAAFSRHGCQDQRSYGNPDLGNDRNIIIIETSPLGLFSASRDGVSGFFVSRATALGFPFIPGLLALGQS